jgi:serine/threonine protein kinase
MASKRKVNLTDYDLTTTLGTGSFGRVMLCKNKKSGEYFAMKRLKKADIIKLRQVDHVISENTILADIDHPFLVSYLTLQFKSFTNPGHFCNDLISIYNHQS